MSPWDNENFIHLKITYIIAVHAKIILLSNLQQLFSFCAFPSVIPGDAVSEKKTKLHHTIVKCTLSGYLPVTHMPWVSLGSSHTYKPQHYCSIKCVIADTLISAATEVFTGMRSQAWIQLGRLHTTTEDEKLYSSWITLHSHSLTHTRVSASYQTGNQNFNWSKKFH